MTKQEIRKRVKRLYAPKKNTIYLGSAEPYPSQRDVILDMYALVCEAYEEAARVAENPETSYKRVWEACDVPEAMREGIATAIRALKDNLTERTEA